MQKAKKYYHGVLFSIKQEKIKNVSSLHFSPNLTEKQVQALQLAMKEKYYHYPRAITIPQLAKIAKKSYSTFQEHLRRAEEKIISYFLKYRYLSG